MKKIALLVTMIFIISSCGENKENNNDVINNNTNVEVEEIHEEKNEIEVKSVEDGSIAEEPIVVEEANDVVLSGEESDEVLKDDEVERRRVEVLKSNKKGDPDANKYDFGVDDNCGEGTSEDNGVCTIEKLDSDDDGDSIETNDEDVK